MKVIESNIVDHGYSCFALTRLPGGWSWQIQPIGSDGILCHDTVCGEFIEVFDRFEDGESVRSLCLDGELIFTWSNPDDC